MLKWLHRGVVGVLLVVAAFALIALVLPGQRTLHSSSIGHKRGFRLIIDDGLLIGVTDYVSSWPSGISRPRRIEIGNVFVSERIDSSFTNTEPPMFLESAIWILSIWPIALMALPYPCIFLYRTYRRGRGKPANACTHCAYDLTGNQSGVCPECGEAVEVVA